MRKEKKKQVSDVATANSLDNCEQTVYIGVYITDSYSDCKWHNKM